MFLLLDNYDSFVYNLGAYFQELGQEIVVKCPNEISVAEIEIMDLEGIIISPGPGRPNEAVRALEIIDNFKGKIPILGVCLGHQAIGYYFGADVKKGFRPMHGKLSLVTNNGKALFAGLPREFKVTRYHSLEVFPDNIIADFDVDATSQDGVVMAISHKQYPIYGIQYHPEAILTEYGYELLGNFIQICKKWRNSYETN